MKAWTIVGYTYRADILCPDCAHIEVFGANPATEYIAPIEVALDAYALMEGIDRRDERTFDSGDFPKIIFASDVDGETCGECGEEL